MSDDLFGSDVGKLDSPRLRWAKRNAVRTRYDPHLAADPEEMPWRAWLPENEDFMGRPERPDLCGFGHSEADAQAALCLIYGIKHWTQEAP